MYIIFYLTFLRAFLGLPKLLPHWDNIFQRFLIFIVIPALFLEMAMLLYTQFNYNRVDIVSIACVILFLAICTAFLFPLYRTKDKKGMFIIFGFVAMGCGILWTIVNRIQYIEFSTFFFRVGTILEIIIFSLGLAYRQKETERMRQEADFALEKSKIMQAQKAQEAKQLEEIDRLKTAFYTNITHEFRTPLTVIMGMTDTINGHDQQKQLIQRNSNNLLQLINQLLDLSKLDEGHTSLKYIQADIIPFLQYLTESFYSLTAEKNIALQFQSEEETLVMDFDETKIQHIINNLLSNAIRFTRNGGEISLKATRMQQEGQYFLEIQVKDNGIGIPAEKLPHIFDRFFQAHEAHTYQNRGTGIGLALAQQLTQLMGGSLSVTSKEGEGSTFYVLLPITNHAKPPDVLLHSPSKKTITPLNSNTDRPIDQPMVLVIEDNRDVAEYIRLILKNDYQVKLATDGINGTEQAFELIPDIIITDVMMPYKDGYEVTHILKTDPRTSHIPIIILTAKATKEDKLHGLHAGADAYLNKPFNKEELLVRMDNLIRLKK